MCRKDYCVVTDQSLQDERANGSGLSTWSEHRCHMQQTATSCPKLEFTYIFAAIVKETASEGIVGKMFFL